MFTTAGLTDSAAPMTALEYASNNPSSDKSWENGRLLLRAALSETSFRDERISILLRTKVTTIFRLVRASN